MVFRKPYAFLIKNFRLMHIILTICCAYLIIKTSAIISFLGDYIASDDLVIGQNVVGGLYNGLMFIIPVLMLVFFIVLLAVMTVKEKPRTFYIVNIIVYFLIFILFIYGHGVLKGMEKEIISPQKVKSLHDLFVYALIFQFFTVVIAAIRGLGFDIRKFDFAKDLHDLDISDEDNEEFEVAINYDFDDTKRKIKKHVRNFKYTYKEHKFVINVIIALVLVFCGYTFYKNSSISIRKYHLNSYISMNGFSTRFTNAYVVDTDYIGNDLNTNLLILKVDVKSNNKNIKKFVTGSYELMLDGKIYHHKAKYDDEFKDIAQAYKSQTLSSSDYNTYVLVYDIGNKKPKKARLKITNLFNQEYVYLDFNIKSFTTNNNPSEYAVNDEVSLKDTNLESTKFTIKNVSIADRVALTYDYCINKDECISSVEYLRPDYYHTGLPKTLIRMEYDFESSDVNSFYKLLSMYGSIEYVIDGNTKIQHGNFKNIKSLRKTEDNIINLEVVKEVENASEVYIVLNIRNREFRYKIK
ncbi:MAG: hypothetical protein IKN87_01380 [Bacilli bacterium]|nr:hypothetical protein [Bacilli bacterium]